MKGLERLPIENSDLRQSGGVGNRAENIRHHQPVVVCDVIPDLERFDQRIEIVALVPELRWLCCCQSALTPGPSRGAPLGRWGEGCLRVHFRVSYHSFFFQSVPPLPSPSIGRGGGGEG